MMHVTFHAVQRYQERVENVTEDAARARLSCPAIVTAAKFGAPIVRLGSGHRVVIKDGSVVTVLLPAMRTKAFTRMRHD